ncbi:MAG: carboxymuconolactone decarboxylase family protein [Rhizomicrobium sp.]
MPLIPYADIETLPPDTRAVFDGLKYKLNIFRMMSNAVTNFGPALGLGNAILSKQKLHKALREMIILAVARLEGGVYEWVQHVPIGERAGCTKDQIAALEILDFDAPVFDDRAKAMLNLVRGVVQKVKADETTVEAANIHFSPQEIVEIILTCGFYMTMARLTETTRVDVDAPPGVPIPTWHKVT